MFWRSIDCASGWHYFEGKHWLVPDCKQFVAQTELGTYSVYPAVNLYLEDVFYILLREKEGECRMLACWERPGMPDGVDNQFFGDEPQAQAILTKATDMLRNAWKNL